MEAIPPRSLVDDVGFGLARLLMIKVRLRMPRGSLADKLLDLGEGGLEFWQLKRRLALVQDLSKWQTTVRYQTFSLDYVQEPTGFARLAGKLSKGPGAELLDLGTGTVIDVLVQAWKDLDMLASRDLTWGQYGKRLLVEVGGSILGWGAGILTGTGFLGEIGAAIGLDYWLKPDIYEGLNLYATSETVGPSDPAPW